jgi:hypothetical protein
MPNTQKEVQARPDRPVVNTNREDVEAHGVEEGISRTRQNPHP